MLLTLMLAIVAASLGFLAHGLLASRRLGQCEWAYRELAWAVGRFTRELDETRVPSRVTDLFVPGDRVRELRATLDRTGEALELLDPVDD